MCGPQSTCGDGIVDGGEQCDDGNTQDGDGCSSSCALEQNCGDGVVNPGEECDDGNWDDGDGCSSNCTIETGSTCIQDADDACTAGNAGPNTTGQPCDPGNQACWSDCFTYAVGQC